MSVPLNTYQPWTEEEVARLRHYVYNTKLSFDEIAPLMERPKGGVVFKVRTQGMSEDYLRLRLTPREAAHRIRISRKLGAARLGKSLVPYSKSIRGPISYQQHNEVSPMQDELESTKPSQDRTLLTIDQAINQLYDAMAAFVDQEIARTTKAKDDEAAKMEARIRELEDQIKGLEEPVEEIQEVVEDEDPFAYRLRKYRESRQ